MNTAVSTLGLAILHALAPRTKGSRAYVPFMTIVTRLDQPSLAIYDELAGLKQEGLVLPGPNRSRSEYRITPAGTLLLHEAAN